MIPSVALTMLLSSQACDFAVSTEANRIADAEDDLLCAMERSVALFGPKEQIMSLIFEIADECREADWDGYGAMPLSPSAVAMGNRFVRLLPDALPAPEVSPEPDGSLAFEWTASRSRRISMSFGESDRIAYAWLDGSDRGHAVARFDGQTIPERVLDAIASITA